MSEYRNPYRKHNDRTGLADAMVIIVAVFFVIALLLVYT